MSHLHQDTIKTC